MLWSGRRERSRIALYRALLATAPTETIEQVHRAAFARLGDTALVQLYEELSRGAGTGERPRSSEVVPLARAVARRELRQPGSLEPLLLRVSPAVLDEVSELAIASPLASAFLPWAPAEAAELRGEAAS